MERKNKLVFLSNYFNHHQRFLADEFYRLLGDGYTFIETMPMEEERKSLGWNREERPYLFSSYGSDEAYREALDRINSADVVIWGSAPDKMVRGRIKAGKLTFRYSERVYKKEPPRYEMPLRALKYYFRFGRYKNVHLLCASAYTAGDYARTRTFVGKAYKWGYFTEVKKYEDPLALIATKKPRSILWVARFLTLKRPEAPIEVARRLRKEGYQFELNMIGVGEELERARGLVEQLGLADCVHLLGSMKPEEVRAYMERSEIFLFTSDRREGWGAVLNESMNSGCAVVASHAIGAAPFLIKDGENGELYCDGDTDALYQKVKTLLDCPERRERLGKNAYETMAFKWSPQVAAERFAILAAELLEGAPTSTYDDGPCSIAPRLRDNWYMSQGE